MKVLTQILLTLSAVSTAFAQSNGSANWAPPSGSKVRLTSPALRQQETGSLISADNDSVVVRLKNFVNPYVVQTSNVTRLEVARGTHTNKAKGALVGFLLAGGITAALTAATWHQSRDFDFGRWGDAAFYGGFAGLVGAGVGFAVGIPATDTWERVPIPRT